jgi:hypothetical protein
LCRFKHILGENAVAFGGVVDKDAGNGADEFSVLDYGTAGRAEPN